MFSGGLDSMVLAEMAYADPDIQLSTIFFRYMHPACGHEYTAAAEWRRRKLVRDGVEIRNIEAAIPVFSSALDIGVGSAGPRVVPGRNLVMVGAAVSAAVWIGATEVWFGANMDDTAEYPDCRPGWVEAVSQLASDWGVRVVAPLAGSTKLMILDAIKRYQMEGWWSCYQPNGSKPCNSCNSCVANSGAHTTERDENQTG